MFVKTYRSRQNNIAGDARLTVLLYCFIFTARRGKVASCSTRETGPSLTPGCRSSGGDDSTITVSPRVARLRETIRLTLQHVTSFVWSTHRTDRHITRTVCQENNTPISITRLVNVMWYNFNKTDLHDS